MDISDIVTTEYETFGPGTRVSSLEGHFRDTGTKAVVVTEDGEYRGLVTQRQLASANRNPDTKARSLLWHVSRIDSGDDVRTVARRMLGSNATVLPVFEDDDLIGVVTSHALLEKVQPYLRVLTVATVASTDLVAVAPETTLGAVVHRLREERITHVPVVDDTTAVGVVSLADLIDFTARETQRSQGGSPAPGLQTGGGRSHGGFGERAGDIDRLLDVPVENVMTTPVETTTPETRLDEAVQQMLDAGVSSLVVIDDGRPVGIVTQTDVLRALTWTDETHLPVQITNVELLDDISREGVAEMIEDIARKYGDMSVLEANVFLHEHDETLRGTPLLMARVRLFTDKGHFVGTGEGYGARHALRLACNVLERTVLEGKEYARTKKHPDDEHWSRVFGWWLTGEPRHR